MRRAALGIIAVLLFGGGVALFFVGPTASSAQMASAVMIKTGAVLILFWLAYHQVLRLFEVVPPWMIGIGFVGLGAIIAYPKSLVVVLCLFAALAVLHYAGFLLKPQAEKTAKGRRTAKSQISNPKSQISNPKSEISNLKS